MGRQRTREDHHVQSRFERDFGPLEVAARAEGPAKKHWTAHDMKVVRLRTDMQHEAVRAYIEGDDVALIGSAGTGKTFLAAFLAANSFVDSQQGITQIIHVRSPATSGDVGFLPGSLDEKGEPFEEPAATALAAIFGRPKTYEDMKEAKVLHFRLTTHLRGLTWDNAILWIEEAQNMTFKQLYTILTRVGNNTRIIITGDTKQIDLEGKAESTSGLADILDILQDVRSMNIFEFTPHDIVRSEFVKSFVMACENRVSRYVSG